MSWVLRAEPHVGVLAVLSAVARPSCPSGDLSCHLGKSLPVQSAELLLTDALDGICCKI